MRGCTYPVDAQDAALALGDCDLGETPGDEKRADDAEDAADDERGRAGVDGAADDVDGDVDCAEDHDEPDCHAADEAAGAAAAGVVGGDGWADGSSYFVHCGGGGGMLPGMSVSLWF